MQETADKYTKAKEEQARDERQFDFFGNYLYLIIGLLILKIIFQLIIIDSGYRWLSADDYTRTVKSYEWLQRPEISSGVWLTPHFWILGFVMIFIKNLVLASNIVSTFFAAVSMIYYYKLVELCFNRKIAFFSTLIFIFFPFQVWLSISGLPEPIFFCFISMGFYYFMKWRQEDKRNDSTLIIAAVSFALANVFRYEGWFFTASFIILTAWSILRNRKLSKELVKDVLISCISTLTIIWWFLQNYIDHGNAMFFAEETTKIFEQFNTAGFLQRTIQYPTFIFYIAPLTTVFGIKEIIDTLRKKERPPEKVFLIFSLLQLALLMIHAMMGTGGTNMPSRYIVMNALFLVPFAVVQAFELRKFFTVTIITAFVLVNIVWCYYYPQPFREDTFEVGNLTGEMIENGYLSGKGKIYFEELEGYYDLFALQALSNKPDKFVLGELRSSSDIQPGKTTKGEDVNILSIKKFLEENNIELAIIKSDGYRDKLLKMNIDHEEIGDYNIFYVKDRKSSVNDSTITLFSKNLTPLKNNPDLINFNKLIGLKNYEIDNEKFGMNPQTVTLYWTAVDTNIIDSLDYDNYLFDRFKYVIEIVNTDEDSTVYKLSNSIFSERNIETLIQNNEIRNIVVLKPFAMLHYSMKYGGSPFEGGVYSLQLKVHDNKQDKDLFIYKGDKYMTPEVKTDTAIYRTSDTSKVLKKIPLSPKDTINNSYELGNIIAMFPDSDYNKLLEKRADFLEITTRNWMQLLFSQRYQGDQVLNWIFNYF